jgi:purine-nucleoside phosphorylase
VTPATPAVKLAVIAGSGMGALARAFPAGDRVSFGAIEGVGACTVEGHAGEVRETVVDGCSCLLVLGRRHLYEEGGDAMERLLEYVAARGATHLLVTSAAGALDGRLDPGDIVVVRDLIDRQNRRGRRIAGVSRPCPDAALALALERAATRAGVRWQRGTLVCGSGPAYETAAEVRSLQLAAAHVATMSAALELGAACRLGIPTAVAAVVTNPGTGIAAASLSHHEVLERGGRAAGDVARIVRKLIVEL